jgi:hypothetical protein
MSMDAPIWWQPVMKELKAIIETHAKHSSQLWEFIREIVAGAVRVDLIEANLTEKQARKAVYSLLLVLLEELKKPQSERSAEAVMEGLKQWSMTTWTK